MDTKDQLMTMMLNMETNSYNHHPHHHLRMDILSDPFSLGATATVAAAVDDQKTSLGFTELLGYQDYYSYPASSIFDDNMMTYHHPPPPPPPSSLSMEMNQQDDHNVDLDQNHKVEELITAVDDEVEEESSVVLNGQPTSPNSSSISSPARMHKPVVEQEKKTTKKKKDKEPRFAFLTRTEMDHLDDGYRWRKYGQKAVKNSHFPRSYYRCTSASCNVKKRVERCMGDSSYVITTYEGKHNHPVIHNSAPLITPSFNHLITTTTTTTTVASAASNPPAMMLKLEQGGLLQDMLPCYH